MRQNLCSIAAAITAGFLSVAGFSLPVAADAADEAAIAGVLSAYETALNASDTNAVLPLYTEDAVLLPQATPTVVGAKAVEQFYIGTFKAIKLNLKFNVAEVVVSNDWAFLRTNSTGSMTILATGKDAPAQTQELFVLHKDAGQWKLARYAFSSTQPGPM